MSAKSLVHVALLRGVNVGGANKLAMADLKAIFEEARCARVETLIQSGNVVFEAPPAALPDLARTVEAEISRRFSIATPVILRSAAAIAAITENNPFLRAGADPAQLHVMLLAREPAPAELAALDPQRSPPDEFIARGSEIYLRMPNGVARTKLSNAYFDRALKTVSTGRNWRTILKLRDAARR